MSHTPEELSTRMHALHHAISEGRYAVDPVEVAQAVLERLAVPEVRPAALDADEPWPGAAKSGAVTVSPGPGRARSLARPARRASR